LLKKLLAALGTLALVLGLVALVAGPASAHNHTVSASCDAGVSIDLTYYATGDATKHNTVKVWIDGAVVTDNPDFGASFSQTYPFSTGHASHTYRVVVTAYDDSKYSFDTGVVTVNGCETAVTPAAATSTDPYCTAAGTVGGGGYAIPPQQSGVQYQLWNGSAWVNIGAGSFGADPGAVIKVQAIATTGYKFAQGATASWTFTLSSPDASKCVVPVAPTADASECSATPGSSTATYTVPEAPAGYDYFLEGSATPSTGGTVDVTTFPTTIVIVAKANPGYSFPTGTTTTWTFTFSSPGDCHVPVAAGDPVFIDGGCDVSGNPVAGSYTVLLADHVHYVASVNGGAPTPLVAGVKNPAQPGDSVVITPIADTGYVITPAIGSEHLSHVFATPGLCKADFIKPAATSQSCIVTGSGGQLDSGVTHTLTDAFITIPSLADSPHVTYYINDDAAAPGKHVLKPATYVVSAVANTGYFLQGYNGPWSEVLTSAEPCSNLITHPLVSPLASQHQLGCFANGSYTLSNSINDAAALTWTVNGSVVSPGTYAASSAGTVTVHAAANGPAYGLEKDAITDWTFHFVRPTRCDLTTLALTGSTPTGWIVLGYLLLVSGLTLVAVRFARRREGHM